MIVQKFRLTKLLYATTQESYIISGKQILTLVTGYRHEKRMHSLKSKTKTVRINCYFLYWNC